ncbi:MAG: hypothetical protein LBQ20_11150 [Rhodanobacter sp.]|jgi:hypothetical protein|nr:hypothetical protein [Rhodanobacter sp.]
MWRFEKDVRLRGKFVEVATETMRRSFPLAQLAALFVLTSCATPYVYRFDQIDGSAAGDSAVAGCQMHEDTDMHAELRVDPAGEHAVSIEVTNQTDQVLQVQWTKLTMTRADGLVTTLHPDADLGWIEPGQKQLARLIPLALPASGNAALTLDGQRFRLTVPMLVRRERRTYCYDFLAHVLENKEHR